MSMVLEKDIYVYQFGTNWRMSTLPGWSLNCGDRKIKRTRTEFLFHISYEYIFTLTFYYELYTGSLTTWLCIDELSKWDSNGHMIRPNFPTTFYRLVHLSCVEHRREDDGPARCAIAAVCRDVMFPNCKSYVCERRHGSLLAQAISCWGLVSRRL